MSALYVVLPVSLVLVLIAAVLFVWAVRRGQFDDLETPGLRVLHDDEERPSRDEGPSEAEAEPAEEQGGERGDR